jgi:hypothetical protein
MQQPTARSTAEVPKKSSLFVIGLDDVGSPILRKGVDYWRALRGERPYPSRPEITPRGLAPILTHIVLIRVVDGGKDFEFRIAGDAQVRAFGLQFQGMRISMIQAASPVFGGALRAAYEHVRVLGEPYATRGWVGRDLPDSRILYHENVLLPLGPGDGTVDFILAISDYVPKPGV